MNRYGIAAQLRRIAREKPTDITAALLHLAADLEVDRYQARTTPAPDPVVEQPAPVPGTAEAKPEEETPIRRGLLGIFRRPS
ncbi:hypothetical protein FHS43_006221 [Streptosporangium becharense]|uniref:Uncharacterized protein n=1 Tax=Streptosporangium becharense TaxID=1816182 RepID=A0A7W9IH30_9ACTN|nr:hypothetical protein [Streptosporangium becharense]MBB2914909.1 hypothetical protein [Streptosporangium becharense]MBB5820280.1 hypothetical protein [Streptosporangium becharense]